jgi:hypothetical protein
MSKQKALIICLSVISVTILAIFFWSANKKQLNVKTAQSIKTDHPTKHVTITSQPMTISTQIGVPASTNIAELKPIKITPLPKNIQNVIFDQQTGEPSIYITDDHLEFLNKEGKVNKEYKLPCLIKTGDTGCWSKVEFSEGNKFIGVNTIKSYEHESVKDAEFVMLDKEGNELWRKKNNFYTITPSPNGKYFLGTEDPECSGCPIYLVKSAENISKPLIWNKYANNVVDKSIDCFSEDGNMYIVTTLEGRGGGPVDTNKPDTYRETLYVLNSNGDELYTLSDGLIGRSIINNDNLLTMTDLNSKDKAKILKINFPEKKTVWEREIPGGGYRVFYSKGVQDIVAIGAYGTGKPVNIYTLDSTSGKIINEINVELLPHEGCCGTTAISKDQKYFITSSDISIPGTETSEGYLLLINTSGNIARRSYKQGSILSVAFEKNGEFFIVATKKGLETYKNPFYKK